MRTYKLRKNFCLIPDHFPYAIESRGGIYNIETNEDTEILYDQYTKEPFVYLGDAPYELKRLLALTFIGDIDLPVVTTLISRHWMRAGDLDYKIIEMKRLNETDVSIDGYLFRRHPRYGEFLVSENGVIYSTASKRFVHVRQTESHYPRINVHAGFRHNFSCPISHMVYETYIGPLDSSLVIDHKDNIPYHNHWTNLQQITQEENIQRAFAEGNNINRRVFTIDQIETICRMMQDGYGRYEISEALEVPNDETLMAMMGRLYRRNAYKSITSKYDFSKYDPDANISKVPRAVAFQVIEDVKNGMRRYELMKKYSEYGIQSIDRIYRNAGLRIRAKALTHEQVEEIKKRLAQGETRESLHRAFGVNKTIITMIKQGKYE